MFYMGQNPESEASNTWQNSESRTYREPCPCCPHPGQLYRLLKPVCLRSLLALSPADLLPSIYLILGRVAPQHEGLELSVGGATVSAALGEATGSTRGALRTLYHQHGDLGDVAQVCRNGRCIYLWFWAPAIALVSNMSIYFATGVA